LNEANHNGHRDCAKSLRNAGSFLGKSKHLDAQRRQAIAVNSHHENNEEVFFAAAAGDLHELITCNARGMSLESTDYDGRTPLHVAASNGHHACLRYLLI
jgi:ankyrin repeat protein